MAAVEAVAVTRADVNKCPHAFEARIRTPRYVSSYNWIDVALPTIVVPGCPALWSPPNGPKKVQKDSGLVYIAQNAARHPDSPLEPLFRAVLIQDPTFDLTAIDVVTDRNNIRKLFAFVAKGQTGDILETFTINAEFVKDTLILCRNETATQEYIGPNEFRGFGHNYEKVYTKSQISESTGHYRIISYSFCGMNLVVRHETDGYVAAAPKSGGTSEFGDLSSQLQALSLLSTEGASEKPVGLTKLRLTRKGQEVPLESTLEIKTRAMKRPLSLSDVAPQLWVSQTPKLVRAYHQAGRFGTPVVEDVQPLVKEWEDQNQPILKKLGALLLKVRSVARQFGTAVIKYDDQKDQLIISKGSGRAMLPADVYAKWFEGQERDVKPDSKDIKSKPAHEPVSISTRSKLSAQVQ